MLASTVASFENRNKSSVCADSIHVLYLFDEDPRQPGLLLNGIQISVYAFIGSQYTYTYECILGRQIRARVNEPITICAYIF